MKKLWLIAGAVLVVSLGGLFLWWKFRRPFLGHGQQGSVAVASQPRKLAGFEIQDAVLCGNVLVNSRSGEIIAREWLSGFGERVPEIARVMPAEKLVLVKGDNGLVGAFDFDGNAKPALSDGGKRLGVAAFDGDFREVVFARDGNLWRGHVDWLNSKVEEVRKLTDTGYFRDDSFQGRWLWHGENLLLPTLGKLLQVDLNSGAIEPQKANIGEVIQGISPDGGMVLIPLGMRELGVADLKSGGNSTVTIGQYVNRLLWLDSGRAVVQVGQHQLGLYDVGSKKLTAIFEAKEPITVLVGPSPDGGCFLVGVGKNVGIFDLATRKFTPFPVPVENLEWLSDEVILASANVTESAQRGMWLIRRDGGSERLMDQPADNSAARGREAVPILPDGLFISQGELWRFELATKKVVQVTHGAKLPPFMKKLR